MLEEHVTEIGSDSWEIHFEGSVCKFELSSGSDAVLYDLEVAKENRNNGIGTEMIRTAEQVLQEQTDATKLYAQIGASDGATEHVLRKCNFEIIGVYEKETVGRIVDATKDL